VPAQAHRGFPSGPMMTSLIRTGGRSARYRGMPLPPAFEEITFSSTHGVSHGSSPCDSRETRVGVCLDVVDRTSGRRSQASRPVPLSKERFDVALEGRRTVVRTSRRSSCSTSVVWATWSAVVEDRMAWAVLLQAHNPPGRLGCALRLVLRVGHGVGGGNSARAPSVEHSLVAA